VDLYWLDEPFSPAVLGGPGGEGEPAKADICTTKGVRVAAAVPVETAAGPSQGSFPKAGNPAVVLNLPPVGSATYQDGSTRTVRAYYGANALCAVWVHVGAGHDSAVGNQFNLF